MRKYVSSKEIIDACDELVALRKKAFEVLKMDDGMFADLDEKMKHSWRLRWHYRWAKVKLDISEWYWKHFKVTEDSNA